MAEAQLPERRERQEFVARLRELRAALPPAEQRMLDALVAAAFVPAATADVEGYAAFWSPAGPYGPGWYDTGWLDEWDDTPWGTAFAAYPPAGREAPPLAKRPATAS
jgi:hypothetical protein